MVMSNNTQSKKLLFILLSVAIATIISFLPPRGPQMIYVGIFVGMLIVLITQVLEDWIIAIALLAIMVVFKIAPLGTVFATFSQSTIWLIVGVLALTIGINNSGLLNRVALYILRLFPATNKGIILALISTGAIISPLIPSGTAKTNLLMPLATAFTEQMGFKEHSKGAKGIFAATYLPSFMAGNAFLNGSLNVPIMMGFMGAAIKGSMTYMTWLAATSIWLAAIIIGTYVYCVIFCKPEEAIDLPKDFIKKRLEELGPMTGKEKFAGITIILALIAWMTQSMHGIDAGMICLLAVVALGAYGLISTQEFIAKVPWSLIVFVGALLSVAGFMQTLGVSNWVSGFLGPYISPIVANAWVFVPALGIITFLLRYIVISQWAALAIILAIFSPLLPAAGINLFVLVFVEVMCGQVWNVTYQNPIFLTSISAAGGKYVTYQDARPISYAYWVMCIIGSTLSIPLWQLMGFIK
jgi:Di- and tricarboxylate transporters